MNRTETYALIVESDDELRGLLVDLFQQEGFEVKQETDPDACVAQVMGREPGIILLSELLPPADGQELLPLLRRLTRAPIIVMGEGGEAAVVNALLQGADVYMRKPLNFRELLSRVRSLQRRTDTDDNSRSFLFRWSTITWTTRHGVLRLLLSIPWARVWLLWRLLGDEAGAFVLSVRRLSQQGLCIGVRGLLNGIRLSAQTFITMHSSPRPF